MVEVDEIKKLIRVNEDKLRQIFSEDFKAKEERQIPKRKYIETK